jgi:hypothetical protein
MTAPWPNATVTRDEKRAVASVDMISLREVKAQHHLFQAKFCAGFALVSLGQVLGSIPISTNLTDRGADIQFSVPITDFVLTSWEMLGACVLISGFVIMFAGGLSFPHQKLHAELVRSDRPRTPWLVYVFLAIYFVFIFGTIGGSFYLQSTDIISRATGKLLTSSIGVLNIVMFVLLGFHHTKKLSALYVDQKTDAPTPISAQREWIGQ